MAKRPPQLLHPTGRLKRLLQQARQVRAAAHRREAALLMINVARNVRDLFPRAAVLLVDVRNVDDVGGVDVVGVIDHRGQQVWARGDEAPVVEQYRTGDGASWSDVLDTVELDLAESLAGQDPVDVWSTNDGDGFVLHVDLPAVDRVVTAMVGPTKPGRFARTRIRRWNRAATFLPARRSPEVPAVSVAGALVFVYVDRNRARPTLRISVHLDEIDPALTTLPGACVPMQIDVQDTAVYLEPPGE